MFVHALGVELVEADVLKLEALALRAFGPSEALVEPARVDARTPGAHMSSIALGMLALGGACFPARAFMGPSLVDRIVAIDGLVATIVAMVVVNSIRTGSVWLVAVAVTGFLGATAGARFIERRGA